MFKELEAITKSTMIQLLISSEGDQMRVMIMPKAVEGQNPALSTPLSLLATAAELDEKLPEILTNYVTSRQSLEDSLENVKLVMETAKKDAQSKATAKPVKATAAGATTAVKIDFASDEDGDETGTDESATNAPAPTFASKKADDSADIDLFG